jgi:hypothetical protein
MAAITDEIQGLMTQLQKSVDVNGDVDLRLLLQEVVKLFEHLKSALPSTTVDERQKIIDKMAEMHTFLIGESKRLSSQTGLSETQILRYTENPDNFTKEQWELLGGVKQIMDIQSRDIREIMQRLNPPVPVEQIAEANSGEKGRKKKAYKKRV